MSPSGNDRHTPCKLLEIAVLRCPKRVRAEERNDALQQILSSVHDELAQVLAMIVMARGRVDPADPEEVLQLLQSRTAVHALRHNKPMRHLKAGLVAPAPRPIRLSDEADGEASLSVYKTSNPAELNQPFLLVFCTRHIVTVPLT